MNARGGASGAYLLAIRQRDVPGGGGVVRDAARSLAATSRKVR